MDRKEEDELVKAIEKEVTRRVGFWLIAIGFLFCIFTLGVLSETTKGMVECPKCKTVIPIRIPK